MKFLISQGQRQRRMLDALSRTSLPLRLLALSLLFVLQLVLLFRDDHSVYLMNGMLHIGIPLISSSSLASKTSSTRAGSACHAPDASSPSTYRSRFGIVFDAGSTGSRIHVYEFEFCGDRMESLVGEYFREVKPGLSAFDVHPRHALKTLKPLLDAAKQTVPADLHACTPIVLRATAGLRLLPEDKVDAILGIVRSWLAEHGFPLGEYHVEHRRFDPSTAVSVMEGSDEGVLAWITVNFLQGRITHQSLGRSPQATRMDNYEQLSMVASRTSVVVDLGGGSTQLVFAVDPLRSGAAHLEQQHPEYYYQLPLEIGSLFLYQHSFLGYGMMEARKRVKRAAIDRAGPIALAAHRAQRAAGKSAVHLFPCFPDGFTQSADGGALDVLAGSECSWTACLALAQTLFDTQTACSLPPCSFGGIHQPPINPDASIVAFSYLYERTIPLGLASPLTLRDIADAGQKLCRPDDLFLGKNPEWCLDLAYSFALLHHGYGIGLEHPIVVTKEVEGYQAGWCLGTALRLLQHAPAVCPAADNDEFAGQSY